VTLFVLPLSLFSASKAGSNACSILSLSSRSPNPTNPNTQDRTAQHNRRTVSLKVPFHSLQRPP